MVALPLAAVATDVPAVRSERAHTYFARLSETAPTVSLREGEKSVSIQVQGAFPVPSGDDATERARSFLESGVARELGFSGRCRVRDTVEAGVNGMVVVKFDFYEGDARIDGAEAIVHVVDDKVTYIGGGYPVRLPTTARAADRAKISEEQVRSIVLDRLYEKGWTPESKITKHFQASYFDGKPFDPATQFKITLEIPTDGPDLVYDVNTTGAGWGFSVDAHTGEIVREIPPYQPDMGVGIR